MSRSSGASVQVPTGLVDVMAGRPADQPGAGQQPADPGPWPTGDAWLAALPGLLSTLLSRWELTPTGDPAGHGVCAIVVPVTAPTGPAALKVGWPHREARTEHLALQAWAGDGAVTLHRADPSAFALQLELANARDLSQEWIEDACDSIGRLLGRLHRPDAPIHPRMGLLADTIGSLDDRLSRLARGEGPLPRRHLEQARSLIASLTVQMPRRLLHTDLHYANVLGSRRADPRQPWLAIDPKPLVGDPAYEVAPALWNRVDELGAGPALRWSARRRVELICEAAGIDEARARAWTVVRLVANALDEPGDLGQSVALIKAMGD